MPKLYLWNENAFKAFEISFSVDLNEHLRLNKDRLGGLGMGGGSLLESLYISKDLTKL